MHTLNANEINLVAGAEQGEQGELTCWEATIIMAGTCYSSAGLDYHACINAAKTAQEICDAERIRNMPHSLLPGIGLPEGVHIPGLD